MRETLTLDELKEKYPQFDWDAKPSFDDISPEMNIDTTAPALRSSEHVVYTRMRHSFGGGDMVPLVNGKCVGEISGIKKKLDNEFKGTIKFELARFDEARIFPDNSLMVIAFVNEYGEAAYEAFFLCKLKSYKNKLSVDDVCSHDHAAYKGCLLSPLSPAPEELKGMSNEDFEAMVKRIPSLPRFNPHWMGKGKLINHMANRIYYWFLEKYCRGLEA